MVNSELEKTIAPLMSEVERLNAVVVSQKQEIAQMQNVKIKLNNVVYLMTNVDEVNLNQAEVAEEWTKKKNWFQDMKVNESIT